MRQFCSGGINFAATKLYRFFVLFVCLFVVVVVVVLGGGFFAAINISSRKEQT